MVPPKVNELVHASKLSLIEEVNVVLVDASVNDCTPAAIGKPPEIMDQIRREVKAPALGVGKCEILLSFFDRFVRDLLPSLFWIPSGKFSQSLIGEFPLVIKAFRKAESDSWPSNTIKCGLNIGN